MGFLFCRDAPNQDLSDFKKLVHLVGMRNMFIELFRVQ